MESTIGRFLGLYQETMEHRSADSFYKFPRAYFSGLAMLGRQFGIAFAWSGDELAAAAIFLAGREYAHYHLAASKEIGRKYGAATLLVVEGARWARAQGCKLLHLGGGLSPGDTLEDFKRSFDTPLYRYAYLMSVTNRKLFETICRIPNAPWPYRSE